MQIIASPQEFQKLCWAWRTQGLRTALVPTMGFLHAGHVSLIQWARANAERVMVSLFVNPTQFGPNEDLDRYPRDPEGDAAKALAAGADALFIPAPGSMYPQGFATTVSVTGLTQGLCGRSRPGHFNGVATVVSKLLLLSLPSVAVFGQKDWQQLAVIRRLAADLDFPVEIMGCPIVREPDGLALSSRNVSLNPAERAQAPAIHQGLLLAREWAVEAAPASPESASTAPSAAKGEAGHSARPAATLAAKSAASPVAALIARLKAHYERAMPEGVIDYIECVHPETMEPLEQLVGPALMAVAVKFSRARLIDNMLLAQ